MSSMLRLLSVWCYRSKPETPGSQLLILVMHACMYSYNRKVDGLCKLHAEDMPYVEGVF